MTGAALGTSMGTGSRMVPSAESRTASRVARTRYPLSLAATRTFPFSPEIESKDPIGTSVASKRCARTGPKLSHTTRYSPLTDAACGNSGPKTRELNL
jgi:hypothetical protein